MHSGIFQWVEERDMANRTKETNPMIGSAGIWDAQKFHGLPEGVSVLTDEFKSKLFQALGVQERLSGKKEQELIRSLDKALNKYSNLKERLKNRPTPAVARGALKKSKAAIEVVCNALSDIDPECTRLLQESLDNAFKDVECQEVIKFKTALNVIKRAIDETHERWPAPKKGDPASTAEVSLVSELGDIWVSYTGKPFDFSNKRIGDVGTVNPRGFIMLFLEIPELNLKARYIEARFREVVSKRIGTK